MVKAMKERGLIFSGPMVRANLEGRKGQTRRTRGLSKVNENPDKWYLEFFDKETGGAIFRTDRRHGHGLRHVAKCPYGVPGDTFYMRETWNWGKRYESGHVCYINNPGTPPIPEWAEVFYRADNKEMSKGFYKWLPSIHMPRWAARPKRYEITDIRVERVQDISEEDAKAEGIEQSTVHGERAFYRYDGKACWTPSPIESFQTLWDSINAKRGYGWNNNSWVRVVCYRKQEL